MPSPPKLTPAEVSFAQRKITHLQGRRWGQQRGTRAVAALINERRQKAAGRELEDQERVNHVTVGRALRRARATSKLQPPEEPEPLVGAM